MNYEQAIAYIHSHRRFSPVPGLTRIQRLMELLGSPQGKQPFVHIAGTNGKGSTAAMTASVLTAAGYRVGLTISPFVLDFRERIQVCGEMISKSALAETVSRIRPLADKIGGLVEFELVTAVAFDYFARQGCDIVVAEVGLGGKLDATNVIPPPLVAAITSIGLDHTDILGDTTEKIAGEKCGIIKRGTRVVTCPMQDAAALAVIRAQCAEAGCPLIQPDMAQVQLIQMTLEGTTIRYAEQELRIPLAGRHQIANALIAIAICRQLAECGFARLDDDVIAQGIEAVRFPVRMELVRHDPPVILDGAHNPDGAAALARALVLAPQPMTAIIGMLADKDSDSALEILAPRFAHILCVTPPSPRALAAQTLARRAMAFGCADVRVKADITAAIEAACAIARAENGTVVVCGSLYLAAQARRELKGEN